MVIISGLERVPLTGRWRIILISPSEEESIHGSLKENGWFPSVLSLLMPDASSPPPKILEARDWRWAWVESTLRQLEKGAGECHQKYSKFVNRDGEQKLVYPSGANEEYPPPPPPAFPLHPRPRASQLLHHHLKCGTGSVDGSTTSQPESPALEGPPFSLLLVENKEANAFSYGFGGNGAAGIVIYTGLLDEILSSTPPTSSSLPSQPSPPPSPTTNSFFSALFGRATAKPAPSSSTTNPPSEEQTLHLACILAHEMSHLLLSHHLETLSQTSVVLPSMMGLLIDLARTVAFPLT